MKLARQKYAFFPYTDAIAGYCVNNLTDEYSIGLQPDRVNAVRLYFGKDEVNYTFCNMLRSANQRELLTEANFNECMLLPTQEARIAYITELYHEQYIRREAEMDERSRKLP